MRALTIPGSTRPRVRELRVARFAFVGSCVFFAFLGGFALSHFHWGPYAFFDEALDEARAAVHPAKGHHHEHPAKHDFEGAVAWNAAEEKLADAGAGRGDDVVLLTSYWPEHGWKPGIRVIDRGGRVLHSRPVDVPAIWPTPPATAFTHPTVHDAEPYVHGTWLFPDGDALLNVEYLGLARLDPRGDVVWKLDRQTHHAIHRCDDGNFWVCEARWVTAQDEALHRFPGLVPPFVEDRVIEVSPHGDVLKEISVLELLFASEYRNLLWRAAAELPIRRPDPLHLNDVEQLPAAMASRYPTLAAGDLMVSLCFVNAVLVFDPVTLHVKWVATLPLLRQHDPDFLGDGWISVFDNNTDGSPDGSILGGSSLLAFEPATGAMRTIYPPQQPASAHERRFYSEYGGKAQLLPDGDWLLTEATAGRVFEVDPSGRTVWEWAPPRHDDGHTISEVLEGTAYPYSPRQVAAWPRR